MGLAVKALINEKLKKAIIAGAKQLVKDIARGSLVLLVAIQVIGFIDKRVMRL